MASNNRLLGSGRDIEQEVVTPPARCSATRYHKAHPEGVHITDAYSLAAIDADPAGGWVDSKDKLKLEEVSESVIMSIFDVSEPKKRKKK